MFCPIVALLALLLAPTALAQPTLPSFLSDAPAEVVTLPPAPMAVPRGDR